MSFVYLGALCLSLLGLGMIDFRLKLAFFFAPLRATVTLLVPTVLLLIWDAAGIALGIFFRGQTPFLTGVLLAPELPIEEPVFLVLLSYTTLIIFRILQTRRSAR